MIATNTDRIHLALHASEVIRLNPKESRNEETFRELHRAAEVPVTRFEIIIDFIVVVRLCEQIPPPKGVCLQCANYEAPFRVVGFEMQLQNYDNTIEVMSRFTPGFVPVYARITTFFTFHRDLCPFVLYEIAYRSRVLLPS